MPPGTVLTLVVIVGTVWGGLATLLVLALRKERRKETGDAHG